MIENIRVIIKTLNNRSRVISISPDMTFGQLTTKLMTVFPDQFSELITSYVCHRIIYYMEVVNDVCVQAIVKQCDILYAIPDTFVQLHKIANDNQINENYLNTHNENQLLCTDKYMYITRKYENSGYRVNNEDTVIYEIMKTTKIYNHAFVANVYAKNNENINNTITALLGAALY